MNTYEQAALVTETQLRDRLEVMPDDADALLRLGWLRLQCGDYREARELLLKAHVLQPRSVLVRIYAGRTLADCGDLRARDLIREWREWLPLPDQQQFDLADVMYRTEWTTEAITVLEDLLRRAPDFLAARQLLAEMYERVNRLTDARALVTELQDQIPEGDAAARNELAHLQATLLRRAGNPQAARILLEQNGPRNDMDADHYFTLAALADGMGDAAAAMRSLEAAHAMRVGHLQRVAPQRLRDDVPLFPTAPRSLDAEAVAKWPALIAPDAASSPVFVIGFPRSGTTLLEQMLDAHPGLQSMDERPHLDVLGHQLEDYGLRLPDDLHKLTQADCDELRKGYLMLACDKVQRRWGTLLVDKNPLNMLALPLIHRIFPAARFILMLRHPCDVLLSNYMQDYRSVVLMAVARDLAHLTRGYVEAFDYWFHHAALMQPQVLTLRYEDLVADQAGTAAKIASFLGLDNADAMLDAARHAREKGFIGTPSYRQVIEPVNRKSIGRWHRYRPWLKDVLPVLSPMAGRLGYSLEAPA
ncbi:MAG TPA: sulfotransferase [Rhodanobacteraceae bacterium]|jgi:tetratricopeptide (TPR) repeat protein|nr:sulfotransferase [Rhodanobacteraceae bacterium]